MAEAILVILSPVKKNSCSLVQAIFAKQKTKKTEQDYDRHVIKATKEVRMQPLILLLVVVSTILLYVLIIAGCLCYVGRQRRRMSIS